MSRTTSADAIEVKASNNVYTALTLVALIAGILSLVVIFVRASTVFTGGLFGS